MQTAESSVRQVVADLGLTYRQLDHMRRTGVLPPASGSGTRYFLTPDAIARLAVAVALARSSGSPMDSRNSSLPRMAEAVMAGPTPPAAGWACVCPDGSVLYGATLSDVADGLTTGGIVAAFGSP